MGMRLIFVIFNFMKNIAVFVNQILFGLLQEEIVRSEKEMRLNLLQYQALETQQTLEIY